jgi:hypothetical protein
VPTQDIETPAGVETNEVPFGSRSLQLGIQVEGVWISRPNTPPSSPLSLAPKSQPQSITPSAVRGDSFSSLGSTRPSFLNVESSQNEQHQRIAKVKHPKTPSILLTPNERKSFDLPFESPSFVYETASPYTPTLEMLEGRGRSYSKVASDDPRISRHKSTSSLSFAHTYYSGREGSPSPPALTDGNSRSDTPNSDIPSNHTYLSQSNHRLSHVAETGQLGVRSRYSKHSELVIPAYGDAFTYRSAFNFTPAMGRYSRPAISPSSPPALLTPTSSTYPWSSTGSSIVASPSTPGHNTLGNSWPLSSSSNWLPTTPIIITPLERPLRRPKSRSLSEVSSPRVYAPKPIGLKYPELNVEFLVEDPPNLDFNFVPPSSSTQLHSGGMLPIDASTASLEELSQHTEYLNPLPLPNDKARQTVLSLGTANSITLPERALTDSARLEFRRVNENFEVKRGSKGLYVPIDLPSLHIPPIPQAKAGAKKLQKRKPDSYQESRYSHFRSKSTSLLGDTDKTNISGL